VPVAGRDWRSGAIRVHLTGKLAEEFRGLLKRAENLVDFSHFVTPEPRAEAQLAQYALSLGVRELKRKIEESEKSG